METHYGGKHSHGFPTAGQKSFPVCLQMCKRQALGVGWGLLKGVTSGDLFKPPGCIIASCHLFIQPRCAINLQAPSCASSPWDLSSLTQFRTWFQFLGVKALKKKSQLFQ